MSRKPRYINLAHQLPHALSVPLFGDRKRYGILPVPGDPCWDKWCGDYVQVMDENKKYPISEIIYNPCYKYVSRVNVEGKRIMEIGPGDMSYLKYLTGRPAKIELVDIDKSMLELAESKASSKDISVEKHLLSTQGNVDMPFDDQSIDLVFSFFVFEHIYNLRIFLKEIRRILVPGGLILGSIPCEGGLAWGMGRCLTSRRHYINHSDIIFDKIICWEHPNFADTVLYALDDEFTQLNLKFWPFHVPLLDINLTACFLHKKSE